MADVPAGTASSPEFAADIALRLCGAIGFYQVFSPVPLLDPVRAPVPDVTSVWIFHGPNQKRVGDNQKSFGDALALVPISRTGRNALDFHLSHYVGYISSRNLNARFVVISNDHGYCMRTPYVYKRPTRNCRLDFTCLRRETSTVVVKSVAGRFMVGLKAQSKRFNLAAIN